MPNATEVFSWFLGPLKQRGNVICSRSVQEEQMDFYVRQMARILVISFSLI